MDSSLHKTAADAAAAWVGKTYPAADHLMTEALTQRFIDAAEWAADGGARVDVDAFISERLRRVGDPRVHRRHFAAMEAGARWFWDEALPLPITDPATAPKAIPAAGQLAHEILAAASDPTPGDPAVPDDVKERVADELRRLADEYDPRPVVTVTGEAFDPEAAAVDLVRRTIAWSARQALLQSDLRDGSAS